MHICIDPGILPRWFSSWVSSGFPDVPFLSPQIWWTLSVSPSPAGTYPSASPAPPSLLRAAPVEKKTKQVMLHFFFQAKYHTNLMRHSTSGSEVWEYSPPIVCTPPLSERAGPPWPPPAAGAFHAPSPSAAAPDGAETGACENWPVLLSAAPASAASPAPGARSHGGGPEGKLARSKRLVGVQSDCPAVKWFPGERKNVRFLTMTFEL